MVTEQEIGRVGVPQLFDCMRKAAVDVQARFTPPDAKGQPQGCLEVFLPELVPVFHTVAEQTTGQQLTAPEIAAEVLCHTRAQRHTAQAEDTTARPWYQRVFRGGIGKWVVRPIIEMIPSPILYGPGDVVTLVSALQHRDILTGDTLDAFERRAYFLASAIPMVPAFAILEPAKRLRVLAENIAHFMRRERHFAVLVDGLW